MSLISVSAFARPAKKAVLESNMIISNTPAGKTKLKMWNKATLAWDCYCGGVGKVECSGGQMCEF